MNPRRSASFVPPFLSARRGLSPAGRVRGLHAGHLGPLPAAGQRRVLARGVPAVRRVPAAAHHHLLRQRHEALLQERLPAVRRGWAPRGLRAPRGWMCVWGRPGRLGVYLLCSSVFEARADGWSDRVEQSAYLHTRGSFWCFSLSRPPVLKY